MLPLIQPKDIALICTYCYKIILYNLARGRCRHLADLKVMEGQWLKERWDEMQYFSNNTETETHAVCGASFPRPDDHTGHQYPVQPLKPPHSNVMRSKP